MLDSGGNPVIQEKGDREIRIFRGEDSAPGLYPPGFFVSSDRRGWKSIWKGQGGRVDRVSLTAAEISCLDGTQDRFSPGKDPAKLR